jgi:hypothetical protein
MDVLKFYDHLFGVVYLAWWDFAMDSTKELRACIEFCASLGKSATETLTMTRQAFGGEIMSRTWEVHIHPDRKRRDRWRAKSRACSSFSLTSFGMFTKNSSWQAKQSITHTTVTFYCDCVKNIRRFCSELQRPKIWLLHHDNAHSHTSFFRREFLTKNNMTVGPTLPTFPFIHNWR